MPRTKYLVVGTAFSLMLMLSLGMVFAVDGTPISGQRAAVTDSAIVVSDDEIIAPTITVDARGKDPSVRDRLRAKLAHFTRDVEPVTESVTEPTMSDADMPTESPEGENGLIEGGRVVGEDQQGVSPQMGALYTCAPALQRGVPLATPWVKDDVWYPDIKPDVSGAVASHGVVSIAVTEESRTILSDGLPNHGIGIFGDSVVSPHTLTVSVPSMPTLNAVPYCVPRGAVGIALNGVPIYAAQNDYGEDAVAYELLDVCGGRPGENGLYHYYAESSCLFDRVYEGAPSTLLGYALDGFGIFAQNESANDVENSDLDACHGHEHIIPWNGEMMTLYHYHMTDEFPYSVGCFMGEPTSLTVK